MNLADIIKNLVELWAKENNRSITIDIDRLKKQEDVATKLYNTFTNSKSGTITFLVAPTGFGKTEALVAPFLYQWFNDSEWFSSRLFLVEPTHAILSQIFKRIKVYLRGLGIPEKYVGEDHGDVTQPTFLYTAPITLTTVDSYAYGYLAKRVNVWEEKGSITGRYTMPVGLQVNSLTIFDEAHLIQDEVFLAPRVIAKIIANLVCAGAHVVFSTATLAEALRTIIEEEVKRACGVNANNIIVDTSRKIDIVLNLEKNLSHEDIECEGGTLVVVNSVLKAQTIYRDLKNKCKDMEVYLVHSLMTKGDREELIKKLSEKERKEEKLRDVILVGTQSVEVGIDFSFIKLYTELSPIDSLIQRLGRIGRFNQGKAVALIFNKGSHPYNDKLVEETRKTLQDSHRKTIDIGDVGSISNLVNKVYVRDIVEEMSKEGDMLYSKTLEYMSNLYLLASPPEEKSYVKPSFYVSIYITKYNDIKEELGRNLIEDSILARGLIRYSIPETTVSDKVKAKINRLLNIIRNALEAGCIFYEIRGRKDGNLLLYKVSDDAEKIRNRLLYSDSGSLVIACKDVSTIYNDCGLRIEESRAEISLHTRKRRGRG
ncbi:MAG: CRISPR-associated helicase Cas3' [Ignisphaera sp.]